MMLLLTAEQQGRVIDFPQNWIPKMSEDGRNLSITFESQALSAEYRAGTYLVAVNTNVSVAFDGDSPLLKVGTADDDAYGTIDLSQTGSGSVALAVYKADAGAVILTPVLNGATAGNCSVEVRARFA